MVVTSDKELANRLRSLRDWGKLYKDVYKMTVDHTTYSEQTLGMPYYEQYTYQTVGFNLKLPDLCAAMGRSQLQRLSWFMKRRQENYTTLWHAMLGEEEAFIQMQ